MNKTAIVTDSSSDLPEELIQSLGIHVIPLRIIYKDREYRDRSEITPEEIYERFAEEIPKSSLPSPEDTLNMFTRLISEGYTHIIGIFISSGLSGTFNMVRSVTEDLQGAVIELVDSKNLSLGAGFAVLETARELARTEDFDKAVEKARDAVTRTRTFYVIKTLEYLRKGGRIGHVEGTIGDLFNIKPIISVDPAGVYYTFRKIRGRSKSVQELVSIGQELMKGKLYDIGILHGNAPEEAKEVFDQFRGLGNVREMLLEQISPVLAVHTGPGLVGLVISEVVDAE